MGNGIAGYNFVEAPACHETMVNAIKRMDAAAVRKCCEAGLDVNQAIDPHGHTALDVYAFTHKAMIEDAFHSRAQGETQQMSKMFYETEEQCFQVLATLRAHGAVFASRTACLKRSF
eukprot:TRINITY_DN5770_c0_g1_i1.p1 TRINITY_DN5770_c0_g1~~TRINITY_DN5770_c0_g1_i1.p1  ORF type:complete len:117 (-),score=31.83 TRINITY_DN5770_c0_g1_i1:163-513(-)